MADNEVPKRVIEPLDPVKHDRAAFFCGVSQVDNFFKKTANKLSKADNVRVYTMTDDDGKSVIGFYAINTHSIHYSELPEKYAKTRPSQGNIPAAYISMTGRDEKYKRGGYGGDLLVHCLKRIAGIAERIGTAGWCWTCSNTATPRRPSAGSISIPDTGSRHFHRTRCACSCPWQRSKGFWDNGDRE